MLSIQLVERAEDENKTVEEIATNCPPPGWITTFDKAKPEISIISNILTQLEPWFPHKKYLFRAFDLCPLADIKIVILGQDPYHATDNGRPQANGLCFSTDMCHPIQPSLRNIYAELSREYPGEFITPNHGDLSKWASQGVLLLNTCLTVAPHKPASHMSKDKKGSFWNGFITRVFDAIDEVNPTCIYMLWGAFAINFGQKLNQRAIKLIASHPSPFSAHKASKDVPAFVGCGHFLTANDYLLKQGKGEIDWTLN